MPITDDVNRSNAARRAVRASVHRPPSELEKKCVPHVIDTLTASTQATATSMLVHLYRWASEDRDVTVKSWVRADSSSPTYHSPTPSHVARHRLALGACEPAAVTES